MANNLGIKSNNPLKKLSVGNWITIVIIVFTFGGGWYRLSYTEKRQDKFETRLDKFEVKYEDDQKKLNETLTKFAIELAILNANKHECNRPR